MSLLENFTEDLLEEARTDTETGEVKYGYAKYLRDALPNASFIGFTGTSMDLEDRSTIATFGNYIEIVMKQAEMTCGNIIMDEVEYGMVADEEEEIYK